MHVIDALLALTGTALVVSALSDVFQSVIVPRAVGRSYRPTYLLWRGLWRIWPAVAQLRYPRDEGAREDFMAYFAPLTLVLMLVQWVALLIAGYGLIFWSIRSQVQPPPRTLAEACYFAGTSLLTIGFGDVAGRTGIARFLSIAAGASGLGVVSVTTAYLFSIFGAFQTRERFIVNVGSRGGAPPSGLGILAIARYAGVADTSALFRDAQHWAATLMESHLAYPTLAYFRSSHDYESWINTLGALLDASVLLITTASGAAAGEARFFYTVGRHAAHDLSNYFQCATDDRDPLVDRARFERTCDRLAEAGYELQPRDVAWRRFAELRGGYACRLANLGARFHVGLAGLSDDDFVLAQHLRDQFGTVMSELQSGPVHSP